MATNRKPVIEFKDFTFQYRAQSEPTLHEINLTIYRGEKVLIIGPSGSGKSTLASCLNGLIPHFHAGELTGTALIDGEDIRTQDIFKLSRKVGTVLQDPDGQFVGMTVAEDIAFSLENDGIAQGEMKERVRKAARSVGMEAFLGASPQTLSGGQKQRTSMAGVLVSEADILLFDEPLASLDPEAGQQAVEMIDRIHAEMGKTVIIVEHRLEEVLHRGVDRIILMSEGRVAADARPSELLSSNLLQEMGIREPLYLTALKYAGCDVTPGLLPENIEKIRIDESTEPMQAWYDTIEPAPTLPERKPALELEGISFSYDDRPVLKGLSLKIGEGEMVGIVGRNGAGKSTLSKLVCGFYKPEAGRILYRGIDMAKDTIKERAGRIGYVMQNPNHMISKTLIYDEIALGLQLRGHGEEEIRERVYDTLRICGLYPFRNWPVSALSYGQKKRVTIASILVLDPEVIILDEPTAGQDFRHYNEMMEFLLELNRRGKSIVIITHDMHLLLEYAERTIVIGDGRVLADTIPADVLTDAALVKEASLRQTSIQRLAERAGIGQPKEFLRRFISYDRRVRGR